MFYSVICSYQPSSCYIKYIHTFLTVERFILSRVFSRSIVVRCRRAASGALIVSQFWSLLKTEHTQLPEESSVVIVDNIGLIYMEPPYPQCTLNTLQSTPRGIPLPSIPSPVRVGYPGVRVRVGPPLPRGYPCHSLRICLNRF